MLGKNLNFPILATKRIIVSKETEHKPEKKGSKTDSVVKDKDNINSSKSLTKNEDFKKVKVEFSLKTKEPEITSKLFDESFSEYAQHLKINFMVLDDSSAPVANYLIDPETRYQSLTKLENLESKGSKLNKDVGSVSLSEVLQKKNSTKTPASDKSGDYLHDINYELEIPLDKVGVSDSSKLHLVGFMHMDVDSYIIEKGGLKEPGLKHPVEKKGSELVYDLLLDRKDEGLEVQSFRDVFYVEQRTDKGVVLEPYYGPAHYHGKSNPGPGGYIGWMAGLAGKDMGPKLEVRRVKNNKVLSVGDRLRSPESLVFESRTGFPDAPAGDVLESYVSSITSRSELIDSSIRMEKLIQASDFISSVSGKNFMKTSDVAMNFVTAVSNQDPETGELTNENSNHSVIVGIDYFRLVRDRSNYGDILNFHENAGNENLVKKFLASSRILNLEVTRERVTNNPYNYNDNCSLTYVPYDLNEPRVRLVNAQDRLTLADLVTRDPNQSVSGETLYKNKLVEATSQLCSIKEVQLTEDMGAVTDPLTGVQQPASFEEIPGYNRFFYIKDYDLFHNVQTGKYRHNLNLFVVDGVSNVLRKTLKDLRQSVVRFLFYISQAEQPVIRDNLGTYVDGNYDYSTNDFSNKFKSRDFSQTILSALSAYQEAVLIISGNQVSPGVIDNLVASLDPKSTTLHILNDFLKTLETLTAIFESILSKAGDSEDAEDVKKQGQTYVPSSIGGTKARIIEVEVNSMEIIEAISDGAIMANYSIFQATTEDGRDATPDVPNLSLVDYMKRVQLLPEIVTHNSPSMIIPKSYSQFSASPFVIKELVTVPKVKKTATKKAKPGSKMDPITGKPMSTKKAKPGSKMDPLTGRPMYTKPGSKMDPFTGKPMYTKAGKPGSKMDPVTGRPKATKSSYAKKNVTPSKSYSKKTAPKVVSTYVDFKALKGNKLNNEILTINSMRSKENVKSGFASKPPSSKAFDSFLGAGVKLTPLTNLSKSGIGKNITFMNPTATKLLLKDIFIKAEEEKCLELSNELKATLQAAAFNGVTRKEVIEIAEKNYSDLIQAKNVLGPVYDAMIPLLGSLQAISDKISKANFYPPTQKEKFTKDKEPKKAGAVEKFVPYEKEKSSIKIASPGAKSKKLSIEDIKTLAPPIEGLEKFVMIKIDPKKKEDGIVPVNNGYLFRV